MTSNTSNVDRLRALVATMPEPDRRFAASMLRSLSLFGAPTQKQSFWIDKLVDRYTNPQPTPTPVPAALGSFAKVYAMFARAKQALRYPKVRLQAEPGLPVVLSMAGERSTQPGVINVTDGGPYGANKWYGRVLPDGTWNPGRQEHPELPKVAALLQRLGDAPEATAAEYGRLTGYCCFCSRPLSNEQSTAAGYGPICAEKFGLAAEYHAAKPILPR